MSVKYHRQCWTSMVPREGAQFLHGFADWNLAIPCAPGHKPSTLKPNFLVSLLAVNATCEWKMHAAPQEGVGRSECAWPQYPPRRRRRARAPARRVWDTTHMQSSMQSLGRYPAHMQCIYMHQTTPRRVYVRKAILPFSQGCHINEIW